MSLNKPSREGAEVLCRSQLGFALKLKEKESQEVPLEGDSKGNCKKKLLSVLFQIWGLV